MIHMAAYKKLLVDQTDAVDQLASAGVKRDDALFNDVTATVKPVRHTIKIEALNP